jgi:hypothetical protein
VALLENNQEVFMNRIQLAVVGLALAGLAVAQSSGYSLVVNGQVSSDKAVVVNGKTYVPLSALKSLGVTSSLKGSTLTLSNSSAVQPAQNVAAGGANQRPSLEGCLGEQLFNGVWRIRASKLERISKDGGTPGWGLTLELRNGSKATLISTDAGIDGTGQGIQLAFDDATTLKVDPYDVQKLTYASLPQGGAVIHQLKFYYPSDTAPDAIKTPTKFLLEVSAKGIGFTPSQQGVAFTVPNPSFRVRLDCLR